MNECNGNTAADGHSLLLYFTIDFASRLNSLLILEKFFSAEEDAILCRFSVRCWEEIALPSKRGQVRYMYSFNDMTFIGPRHSHKTALASLWNLFPGMHPSFSLCIATPKHLNQAWKERWEAPPEMTNVQTRHHSVCNLQCSCRGQAPLFQNPFVTQQSKISSKEKFEPNQFEILIPKAFWCHGDFWL